MEKAFSNFLSVDGLFHTKTNYTITSPRSKCRRDNLQTFHSKEIGKQLKTFENMSVVSFNTLEKNIANAASTEIVSRFVEIKKS